MKRLGRILLLTAVIILVAIVLIPMFIPIPPLEGTVPPRLLADQDSQFASINGLELHYKASGAGPTSLVLLHGFGSSLFSWREISPPLAEEYSVAAFDRPAFGLTERPIDWEPQQYDGNNPYSADFQAHLTIGLMDFLEMQKSILVGNSAGGTVATLTALMYPDRVQALVLVDAAIYTGGGSPAWFQPLTKTPQIKRIGPLITRRIQTWGRDFALSAWHDPAGMTDEIWDGYTKPLQAENWDQALWNLTAASRDLNLETRLSELRLPVLVITGDDDRIVPTKQSVQLASDLPNAKLVIIPDCGHVPQEECPVAFLDAVNNFISSLN